MTLKRTDFAKMNPEDQEITVSIDKVTKKAQVCCTWPAKSRAFEKKWGPPTRVTMRDGKVTSAFWDVEAMHISFRKRRQNGVSDRVVLIKRHSGTGDG